MLPGRVGLRRIGRVIEPTVQVAAQAVGLLDEAHLVLQDFPDAGRARSGEVQLRQNDGLAIGSGALDDLEGLASRQSATVHELVSFLSRIGQCHGKLPR